MAGVEETVYDFSASLPDGRAVNLVEFRDQVLLIVNTASRCGFTPQYASLEQLYRAYKERGFAVLGFPCNQFGAQEPGTAKEIGAFCERNYGVSFPIFAKIDVNGPTAHPLYAYLRAQAPGDFGPQYGDFYKAISNIRPDADGTDEVKWNFTKFLIGRDGTVIKRYEPPVSPSEVEADLAQYL